MYMFDHTSMQVWAAQGKRGVWLKLPRLSHSQLIPVAVEPGFEFHHAEADYVVMTKWLPPNQPNTLPPNASHQVGVGAIVVNERQEMLVVQEKNGPLRGEGFWKMPTGLVLAGEDLIDAVEREVFEETGVVAEFKSLIAVRQAHGFMYGKSDMFFCCGLIPEAGATMGQLKPCEREIAAVQWMPIEDYTKQPLFQKLPSAYHMLFDRCIAWAQGRYTGMGGRVFEGSATRPRADSLFWGEDDIQGTDIGARAVRSSAADNGVANDVVNEQQ
eukprot:GHRR01021935.1.p1 GENE.GHRR01021935.1~~GHRR01021935.1.p1  ORF type:complete len:271 (+),score=64.44 GHRR01021935.1:1047-1859(+)